MRARLGLKAPAWARLEKARACFMFRPGLEPSTRAGLGSARPEPGLCGCGIHGDMCDRNKMKKNEKFAVKRDVAEKSTHRR